MRMSRGETTLSRRRAQGGGDDLGACRNAVIEERESREGAAATPHPPRSTNAATELQFVNCNLHSLRPITDEAIAEAIPCKGRKE